MGSFKQLSLEEREKIYYLHGQGKSLRDIAKSIGRGHPTVSRELRRNKVAGKGYVPCKAHEKAVKRGLKQRYKAPLKNPEIFVYVREHLREYGWTPEQIAGRLKLERPGCSICPETIYRYIYSPIGKKHNLPQYLTLKRGKRIKKHGRKVYTKGKIPNAVSIELRPKTVGRRNRMGDWESDLMLGKQSDKTAINVELERVSRYTMLSKLPAKTAAAKRDAQVKRYSQLPKRLKKTVTYDNGKENSYHDQVTMKTNMKAYFTHAYSSWEKGSVENGNGRTRRYIPTGTSIDLVTEEQIAYIEKTLNNTPRKCLGYLTPYEKIYQKAVTELPPP